MWQIQHVSRRGEPLGEGIARVAPERHKSRQVAFGPPVGQCVNDRWLQGGSAENDIPQRA